MHAPHLHFPKLPDWLVYAAVVAALFTAAVSRGERADTPEAPPPPAGSEAASLSADLALGTAKRVNSPATPEMSGTAFSVSASGVWLTARHVLEGCRAAALVVSPGRGVTAEISLDPQVDVAVLRTVGGAPPLPLALDRPVTRGERGFHPGYPGGAPGEAASRLLGRTSLVIRGRGERGARPEPVIAWAEAGRTDGLKGGLSGLSGAPVLDEAGEVVGLTVAEAPRRGRIYAASPESLKAALAHAGVRPSTTAVAAGPITVENYGRTADGLRRDLSVAQVVCLKG